MIYRRFVLVACLLGTTLKGALSDSAVKEGAYLTVQGVENLNLTLSGSQGTSSLSGPQICTVGGLPEPYSFSYGNGTSVMNVPGPLAYVFVDVELGSVATVTFYGGEVISTVPQYPSSYKPPFIVTADNTTDTGAATGPLYVTKAQVYQNRFGPQYRLDLAEFFPTAVGQTGWVYGGLADVGVANECIYNITFTAVASTGAVG